MKVIILAVLLVLMPLTVCAEGQVIGIDDLSFVTALNFANPNGEVELLYGGKTAIIDNLPPAEALSLNVGALFRSEQATPAFMVGLDVDFRKLIEGTGTLSLKLEEAIPTPVRMGIFWAFDFERGEHLLGVFFGLKFQF